MSLNWQKQALQSNFARRVRAATRRHPDIDGHTYGYTDLKELWMAEDIHMACTHEHDPVWQYWYDTPEGGWKPISIHKTREEALDAAGPYTAPPMGPQAGTYVLARFGRGRWLRVKIESKNGVDMISEAFSKLGAETKLEHIDAA